MRRNKWALMWVSLAMVAATACGVVSLGEAHQVLEASREIQRMESQEVQPLLNELDPLRNDEIEPRSYEIEDLARQVRDIERNKIEPIAAEYEGLDGPNTEFFAKQAEYEKLFRVLKEEGGAIENEARQLEKWFHERESQIRSEHEVMFAKRENEREQIGSQLRDLRRGRNSPADEIWQQIEMLRQQSHGSPDVRAEMQVRFRQIEDEERQLGRRSQEFQRWFDEQHYAMRDEQDSLINQREARREEINQELRGLYHGGATQGLRRRIEDLYARMNTMSADTDVFQAIQKRVAELEQEAFARDRAVQDRIENLELQSYAIEDELQAVYQQFEDRFRAIQDQYEVAMIANNDRSNQLQDQRFALEEQGRPNPEDEAVVMEQIRDLERQAKQLEEQVMVRSQELEDRNQTIEYAVRDIQDQVEERLRVLRAEFEDAMKAVELRRQGIDDRLWTLEAQAQNEMEGMQVSFDERRRSIDDRLTAVRQGERDPLQDRIRQLEDELGSLRDRERQLSLTLRNIRDQVGPRETLLKGRLLDLLEVAVGGLDSGGVTNPPSLTQPSTVPPSTDEPAPPARGSGFRLAFANR